MSVGVFAHETAATSSACELIPFGLRPIDVGLHRVGGGFSLPVVADIRRTLALGTEHASALHARLVTTTRLVVPSAVVAVLTGVALIQLRGGFSAVPRRFHIALGLALLTFLVGGGQTNPAITALGRALASGDPS